MRLTRKWKDKPFWRQYYHALTLRLERSGENAVVAEATIAGFKSFYSED